MTDLETLVVELVRINSINPALVPGAPGEGAVCRFIEQWARGKGLEVYLLQSRDNRPSVVAVARGTGGGRSLMLNGHVDTVGVEGMDDPFSGRIADDRLYGRGAYDMKGGVAACLWAAAQAARLRLRGDVVAACVADEEVASAGTAAVLAGWHTDAAIVTEPTELDVCIAHKGFVWLEVEVQGRAAHGSRPELGIDAIAKAGPVLCGVEDLGRALQRAEQHPLLGTGSVHISLIQGGQEMSSYPDRCLIGIERRTVPGVAVAQVEGELREILAQAARRDPAFSAVQRTTLVREPFLVPEPAPIVQLVRRHAGQISGAPRRVYGETYWMDSALIAAAGIPTVIFGPSGAGAHAIEEWVSLRSVQQCAEVLLAAATEFCA
jgi:acetylornithine deacetylase